MWSERMALLLNMWVNAEDPHSPGSLTRRTSPAQVVHAARSERWSNEQEFNPSYNAQPGSTRSPVVRMAEGNQREITTMRHVLS